jgi:hypothetical protein
MPIDVVASMNISVLSEIPMNVLIPLCDVCRQNIMFGTILTYSLDEPYISKYIVQQVLES